MKDWEIVITLRIGGGGRIGADGMALWFVQGDVGELGPIFGSQDKWNGLAVFIDTYDSDPKRNNPYVSAVYNDGTQNYSEIMQTGAIKNSCQPSNWRRNPYINAKIKIVYQSEKLSIYIEAPSMDRRERVHYIPCVSDLQFSLSDTFNFMVSASTGEYYDSHDLFNIRFYNLDPDIFIQAGLSKDKNYNPENPSTRISAEQFRQFQDLYYEIERLSVNQHSTENLLVELETHFKQFQDYKRDSVRLQEFLIQERKLNDQLANDFRQLVSPTETVSQSISEAVQELGLAISGVRSDYNVDSSQVDGQRSKAIGNMFAGISDLKAIIDSTRYGNVELIDSMQNSKAKISSQISKSTEFDIWTYFLFIEAFIAAGVLVFYRKKVKYLILPR